MTVCHKQEPDLTNKLYNHKKSNVKCVVVGDAMVGKTSLARRLACLGFAPDYNPTTFDNYAGELVKLLVKLVGLILVILNIIVP